MQEGASWGRVSGREAGSHGQACPGVGEGGQKGCVGKTLILQMRLTHEGHLQMNLKSSQVKSQFSTSSSLCVCVECVCMCRFLAHKIRTAPLDGGLRGLFFNLQNKF